MRGLLYAAAVFLALSLVAQGGKYLLVQSAEKQYVAAQAECLDCTDHLQRVETKITKARLIHRAEYLKDVSLEGATSFLEKAKQVLASAGQESHPGKKSALTRSAKAVLASALSEADKHDGYLSHLDEALAQYLERLRELPVAIADARKEVDSLKQSGFFARHFEEAEQILTRSRGRLNEATARLPRKDKQGRPDYLAIYDGSCDGISLAKQAYGLAEAVPRLRAQNEQRAGAMENRLDNVGRRYYDAIAAAKSLSQYPNYRCEDEVESAYQRLDSIRRRVRSAREANQMEYQRFDEAAVILSTAEDGLDSVRSTFDSAVSHWNQVQLAIRDIPGAQTDASDAISKARAHITSNSQNSQSSAEGKLSEARSSYSTGGLLVSSDPPRSLAAYHNAESEAESAYNAVDTSTPSTTSTDTWSTTSPTDIGGGSTTGGGLGGLGGGGGGISGGGFGGPSGGGYGGPSGGGVGGGGL